MPIPAGPILAAVAIIGTGVGATVYIRNQEAKKRKAAKAKAKKTPPARSEPVFAEFASLGNSPDIVNAIVYPIELGKLSPVALRLPDGVTTFDDLVIRSNEVLTKGKKLLTSASKGAGPMKPKDALGFLVTNLSPQATKKAWDALKSDIKVDGGVNFDEPSLDLDRVVKRVLKILQPSVNWDAKTPESASQVESSLFAGVALLGELMYQSIWNDYAKKESSNGGCPAGYTLGADGVCRANQQDGGGLIPPDGPPSQTIAEEFIEDQWINFYQSKTLDGVSKVVGTAEYGTPNGPVFAEIKVFSDNKTKANGNYTGVANFVASNSPLNNSLVVLFNKDVQTLLNNLTNQVTSKANNLA
jgi:hypothetical protein